ISSAGGIGFVIVTPLSPNDFSLTFQSNLANINWPQVTVSVSNSGGGNVAINPSTIYNGVGNSLETLTFSGSNNNDFALAFNGVSTANSSFTYRNDTTAQPNAATLSTFIQTIPGLNGNVVVLGNNVPQNSLEGPFFVIFNNQLAGFS